MDDKAIERLAANSSPLRLVVDADTERRDWVVRFADTCSNDASSSDVVARTRAAAGSAVHGALVARNLPAGAPEDVVTIAIRSIGNQHAVVSITTRRMDEEGAHASLVAAGAALRELDASHAIDDLQGIPRRYWRSLVGERGQGNV